MLWLSNKTTSMMFISSQTRPKCLLSGNSGLCIALSFCVKSHFCSSIFDETFSRPLSAWLTRGSGGLGSGCTLTERHNKTLWVSLSHIPLAAGFHRFYSRRSLTQVTLPEDTKYVQQDVRAAKSRSAGFLWL